MHVTKVKEDRINLFLYEHELEDLRSAVSLALRHVKKDHPDSPMFQRDLKKLKKGLWKVVDITKSKRLRSIVASQIADKKEGE